MNLVPSKTESLRVKEWIIYSIEHAAYWNYNLHGYTFNIECAGRFTYNQALRIVRDANKFSPEEMLIPVFEGEA